MIVGSLSPKQKARLENLRFFFENEMIEEGGDSSSMGGGKYKKQIVKLQHQRGGDESKQGVWKERYISPQAQQNEEAEIYPILDIEFNANEEENEAEQLAAAEAAAAAEAEKAAAEAAAAAEAEKAAAEVARITDEQLMIKLEAFNNEIKFDSDVVAADGAADGAVGNEDKHRDDDSNIINEGTRILNILNNYLNAGLEEEKEDFIKLVFYYENDGTIYWNYNGDLTTSQENAIGTHITENEEKEEKLHEELDKAIEEQKTQLKLIKDEEAKIRNDFNNDMEEIATRRSGELNFDGIIEYWSEIANNPIYYKLITKFYELTGVPILVNTSFNIRGEPIVCSIEDTYRCFMTTELDFLVCGNQILDRNKQIF